MTYPSYFLKSENMDIAYLCNSLYKTLHDWRHQAENAFHNGKFLWAQIRWFPRCLSDTVILIF